MLNDKPYIAVNLVSFFNFKAPLQQHVPPTQGKLVYSSMHCINSIHMLNTLFLDINDIKPESLYFPL